MNCHNINSRQIKRENFSLPVSKLNYHLNSFISPNKTVEQNKNFFRYSSAVDYFKDSPDWSTLPLY